MSIEHLKILKYYTFLKNHDFFLLFEVYKCKNNDKKTFQEKESTEILKILILVKNI